MKRKITFKPASKWNPRIKFSSKHKVKKLLEDIALQEYHIALLDYLDKNDRFSYKDFQRLI